MLIIVPPISLFCPLICFTHNPQVVFLTLIGSSFQLRGSRKKIQARNFAVIQLSRCRNTEAHLGDVILHVFPETNVHKTPHHLSPQSSGDREKRIWLLSSCVCLRSPDKWQQRQSQVSCCPNVKVTLTDTTHPVLFTIVQYSSAYLCCFVLFVLY